MSLVPKIDEMIPFVEDNNTDLVFITETWLTDLINTNHLQIPSYNLIYKNRSSGAHGGVCLYINNSIKFNVLEDLHDPDFEVPWVRITPTRLPRGFSSIITGTVYHPPSADAKSMLEYLFKSLTEIEGQYPNCGLLLAGDFNRLDIKSLLRQFKMKQFTFPQERTKPQI
jgi:exonuclease III